VEKRRGEAEASGGLEDARLLLVDGASLLSRLLSHLVEILNIIRHKVNRFYI
jgi:hypothetical protein